MNSIEYKKCTDVDISMVYKAFTTGFSDYIVKVEIDENCFIKSFLEAEGNSLETSFIALSGYTPVGLILGGIKNYEGIKTMRCGILCVHPDFRGTGISQELFRRHRELAIKEGCKQLILEVIIGNDRAINFYKKVGYTDSYRLKYFSLNDMSKFDKYTIKDILIKETDIKELRLIRNNLTDIHVNWQNDIEFLEKCPDIHVFCTYNNGNLSGVLCILKSGRISFLWVTPKERNKKIASLLIKNAINRLNLANMRIGFPNNSSLEGYLMHIGFEKEAIEQFEMYSTF